MTFICLRMNKCSRMNVICRNDKYFHICYNTSILLFSNRIRTGANPKKNLHSLRNPPPQPKKTNLFIHKVDKNIILNRYHGHYKFKRLTQTSVNNNELKFFFLQKAKKCIMHLNKNN